MTTCFLYIKKCITFIENLQKNTNNSVIGLRLLDCIFFQQVVHFLGLFYNVCLNLFHMMISSIFISHLTFESLKIFLFSCFLQNFTICWKKVMHMHIKSKNCFFPIRMTKILEELWNTNRAFTKSWVG